MEIGNFWARYATKDRAYTRTIWGPGFLREGVISKHFILTLKDFLQLYEKDADLATQLMCDLIGLNPTGQQIARRSLRTLLENAKKAGFERFSDIVRFYNKYRPNSIFTAPFYFTYSNKAPDAIEDALSKNVIADKKDASLDGLLEDMNNNDYVSLQIHVAQAPHRPRC